MKNIISLFLISLSLIHSETAFAGVGQVCYQTVTQIVYVENLRCGPGGRVCWHPIGQPRYIAQTVQVNVQVACPISCEPRDPNPTCNTANAEDPRYNWVPAVKTDENGCEVNTCTPMPLPTPTVTPEPPVSEPPPVAPEPRVAPEPPPVAPEPRVVTEPTLPPLVGPVYAPECTADKKYNFAGEYESCETNINGYVNRSTSTTEEGCETFCAALSNFDKNGSSSLTR